MEACRISSCCTHERYVWRNVCQPMVPYLPEFFTRVSCKSIRTPLQHCFRLSLVSQETYSSKMGSEPAHRNGRAGDTGVAQDANAGTENTRPHQELDEPLVRQGKAMETHNRQSHGPRQGERNLQAPQAPGHSDG